VKHDNVTAAYAPAAGGLEDRLAALGRLVTRGSRRIIRDLLAPSDEIPPAQVRWLIGRVIAADLSVAGPVLWLLNHRDGWHPWPATAELVRDWPPDAGPHDGRRALRR
jgi:hypothetical protein